LKTSEKVYWTKALLAIVTGLICFISQSIFDLLGQSAVMVGIILYIASSEIAAVVFKIDRNRTFKIAIGAFLFVWMFTWTLLNTLSHFAWI
jgi:hypothetical protein